jgi:Mg-chelatase subunit ChlD
MNQAVAAQTQSANNLELNKGDQFIFALDVSRSMGMTDCPAGQSRIQYAKESAKLFASEAAKYDPDGADYFTFGATVTPYLNQTEAQAHALIDKIEANEGSTDTAGVIAAAWKRAQELRAGGVTDNIVLMIVTDGAPNDAEAVKTTIRGIADSLENGEDFGIVFLTVGNIDSGLRSFLTDLDDDLNAKHDIVDVKDFMSVNFAQAFDGATHD